MKSKTILLATLLVASATLLAVPTSGAKHLCPFSDAPQLPGALSQFYDMWNNIWRHYTCGHIIYAEVIQADLHAAEVLA